MLRCVLILLLSITKLQNLKAIHNALWKPANVLHVVINHKTTKFESNSQLVLLSAAISKGCYQSQNYKIWKQFTTYGFSIVVGRWLLSITKLQNLKAIHNTRVPTLHPYSVVINHKTTRFESNLQQKFTRASNLYCCYQS